MSLQICMPQRPEARSTESRLVLQQMRVELRQHMVLLVSRLRHFHPASRCASQFRFGECSKEAEIVARCSFATASRIASACSRSAPEMRPISSGRMPACAPRSI
jgi:hypothetical protein